MRTPNTRALIGVIKTGQSYLRWDDTTYRSVLARLCDGKMSATKCSLGELEKVREYMHEQGFPRTTRRHGRRPKVAMTKTAILSKIEALLAEAKRPWEYAEGMAAHMFKQHVLEWLTVEQLSAVMKALIIHAKRRKQRG